MDDESGDDGSDGSGDDGDDDGDNQQTEGVKYRVGQVRSKERRC